MMKKFLKSLSLVMALVMCFTMVFTAAVSADGATPTITFGVKDSVEPGTVSITVDAANFADVAGVQGEITVGGLTDAAVAAGNIDNVTIDAGVIAFAEEGEANDEGTKLTMADGTLFTITGTAVEGTNITLAWTADETKACDTDEVLLDLSYADKTVEVKAAVVGPTLDEDIDLTGSINIGATVGISYKVTASTVADYASFDIEVVRNAYDITAYNYTTETKTVNADDNGTLWNGIYYITCDGFGLVDMTLEATAVVNCYDAEGNKVAYSKPFTRTIKQLAVELYESTSAVKTKAALADLVNMGTEAQKYFANQYTSSQLKVDVDAGKVANADFDQTYATAELATPVVGDGQTYKNGATIANGAAVILSPTLSYTITPDATPAELAIEISYDNPYNNVPGYKKDTNLTLYNGKYYYSYAELPLYATNYVVTANVYDGETLLGTSTYTVEQWVDANKNHSRLGNVATAIGKFGVSIRAYFNIA